jgi:hypothetical protein
MSDNVRALRQIEERANYNSHERVSAAAWKAGSLDGKARLDRTNGSKNVWWSQTGSNRRPPACKAGALPTELWPRASRLAQPPRREGWWAWEDLNFRPHAYQARALTN